MRFGSTAKVLAECKLQVLQNLRVTGVAVGPVQVILPLGDDPKEKRNGLKAKQNAGQEQQGTIVTGLTGEAVCIRRSPDLSAVRAALQVLPGMQALLGRNHLAREWAADLENMTAGTLWDVQPSGFMWTGGFLCMSLGTNMQKLPSSRARILLSLTCRSMCSYLGSSMDL